MSRVPGDLLLHPAGLFALLLVIANDRVLKTAVPSALTGKLSDFAGLVYFPLFVVALAEGVRRLFRSPGWPLTSRAVDSVALAVGAVFVLIKVWGPAAEVYRSYLGVLLWPFYLVGDVVQGRGLPAVRRVGLVQDATDLLALVVLPVPMLVGRRVLGRAGGRPSSTPPGSDAA